MSLISRIANISTYIFLILTFFLTGVSIIGIWGNIGDVLEKTFASMALVSFAFFIVLAIDGSGHFKKSVAVDAVREYMMVVEWFISLRKISFFIVIISVTVSVFLGLLSIWDILKGDVLYKTLATIFAVGFYALITILVCKQRENAIKSITVEQPAAVTSNPVATQTTIQQPTPVAPVNF